MIVIYMATITSLSGIGKALALLCHSSFFFREHPRCRLLVLGELFFLKLFRFCKCKIFLENDIQVKPLYQSEFAIWTRGRGAIIPRVLLFAWDIDAQIFCSERNSLSLTHAVSPFPSECCTLPHCTVSEAKIGHYIMLPERFTGSLSMSINSTYSPDWLQNCLRGISTEH